MGGGRLGWLGVGVRLGGSLALLPKLAPSNTSLYGTLVLIS